MRGAMRSAILTCGSVAIVVVLAGCSGSSWQFWKSSSAKAQTDPAVATPATAMPAPATPSSATPAPAVETAAIPAPSSNGFAELPKLSDVHFGSGGVTVRKADLTVLDGVVRWLKNNPGSLVMIEAHTDDLGTREANLAVGEKRATSIVKYLVSKGVEPERISTISYGSDRPVCAEKTDTCRAKNRRARFLVKLP